MGQFNNKGKIKMVDISYKVDSFRLARAHARVLLDINTLHRILENNIDKGDVFSVAKIAGILAAKKTSELIPLCHPLNVTDVDIIFETKEKPASVEIESRVSLIGKTGAEMESLLAASCAALTIYDMCKPIDSNIEIDQIFLIEKRGGKSGSFIRDNNTDLTQK